jgi:hypothetical protein
MNIFSALAHLAFNWGTITETYRDHFGQTFFGELLLGELPDAPLLLVNATDLEAGAQEAREVFFKNRAPATSLGRSWNTCRWRRSLQLLKTCQVVYHRLPLGNADRLTAVCPAAAVRINSCLQSRWTFAALLVEPRSHCIR